MKNLGKLKKKYKGSILQRQHLKDYIQMLLHPTEHMVILHKEEN